MTNVIRHNWGMATSLQGDVRDCLRSLPAESIHVAISSPPYWALRSYLPKDSPLKSFELGSEPTPELFIENLVGVMREVKRVLRDDGTLWINLADTYASDTGIRDGSFEMLKSGSRVGIPERFALAMVADGWLWRDSIVWHKPAAMPASLNGTRWERCKVKTKNGSVPKWSRPNDPTTKLDKEGPFNPDKIAQYDDCTGCDKCRDTGGYILRRGSWRTTPAHEMIFMFAKDMGYFADAEAAREPAATATIERNQYSRLNDDADEQFAVRHDHEFVGVTRNPRSVWTIAPEFYGGAHYAAFPSGLPRRIIEASTSAKGCCPSCGACWARVVERTIEFGGGSGRAGNTPNGKNHGSEQATSGDYDIRKGPIVESSTTGWRQTCDCESRDPVPCTVLDFFGGTGTTAQAAIDQGRRAVLCELNPDYIEQQRQRLAASSPLFTQAREAVSA